MVLMEGTTSLLSHDSQVQLLNTYSDYRCYWCATYFNTQEYLWIIIVHTVIKNSIELTSFSITSNE